jgi:uncharacterized membrane protein YfcA
VEFADVGTALHRREVIWQWSALIAVIIVAASAQRITGLGFALVATPVALVLLGSQAVSFIALLGVVVGVLALAATWRDFRPRAVLALTAVTLLSMVPAVLLARTMSDAWGSIAAGVIVIASTSLAAVQSARWARRILGSPVAAGVVTGVSAALAGLPGPPAAAYGVIRKWDRAFVPNLQVVLGLTLPALLIGRGWPAAVPLWLTAASLVAVVIGTVIGTLVRRRISQAVAITGTRILALTGGVLALIHGVSGL